MDTIPRITREQMLIEMAYVASRRGTCNRLHVGAVVARNFHPISTGYVGAPSGEPHCSPDVCDASKPCTRTDHAEANAIKFAQDLTNLWSLVGCDLACTDSPCRLCAEKIHAAGIKRVFYHRAYRLTAGVDYLRENGVEVIQLDRAPPEIFVCPTCHASGFEPSKIKGCCAFCDGTMGGNPPVFNEKTNLWERT